MIGEVMTWLMEHLELASFLLVAVVSAAWAVYKHIKNKQNGTSATVGGAGTVITGENQGQIEIKSVVSGNKISGSKIFAAGRDIVIQASSAEIDAGQIAVSREIADQKIRKETDALRQRRFFGEFDEVQAALALGSRVTEGELQSGTPKAKSPALAWCARILSRSSKVEVAKGFLNLAKQMDVCEETIIADAFIASSGGDSAAGLKILASVDSPSSKSAALMIISHHRGAEQAICWLSDAGIKAADLDSDGKLCLLNLQLILSMWDAAKKTLVVISDHDRERTPALYRFTAIARLLGAVSTEFRSILLRGLPPLHAADFPLASDKVSMEDRSVAQHFFAKAAGIERQLECVKAAILDDTYSIWLELMNPETRANGLRLLKEKLRDHKSALHFIPLGLQFKIDLDIASVDRMVKQNIALHGEITPEAAAARLELIFKQKSHAGAAEYIKRYFDVLLKILDKNQVNAILIEMLARAGMADEAKKRLLDLAKDGLSDRDEARLSNIISGVSGEDTVGRWKKQYETTKDLNDLRVLVNDLRAKQVWGDLCEYARKLFDKTRSLADAEQLTEALSRAQRSHELVEFLESHPEFVEQSHLLRMQYCWSLYSGGRLLESRRELAKLDGDADDSNHRALTINLGIALGDWHELSAFIADEHLGMDKRTAQELLQTAHLAHQIKSPYARDITVAAAKKGELSAGILINAYHLSTSNNWEDEETNQWLSKAVHLSGDDGPVRRVSLPDIMKQRPDWERRESEIWKMLHHGQLPMVLAAEMLNRSLASFMLLPAFVNPRERDPRRRSAIPAYSGKYPRSLSDVADMKIGIDATALLTLGLLGLLDKVIDVLGVVYIPHPTLAWLFHEKSKASFHQPSQIGNARSIRDLLAEKSLYEFISTVTPDSDLSAEIGDGLARMIAEAEKVNNGNKSQHVVVRSSPVHRINSLMEEEVDMAAHANVIVDCLSIVDKLKQKGVITDKEEIKARNYLKLHEKQWSRQLDISDCATLYLDDLTVVYFLHLGLLSKLSDAGFTVVISSDKISECNALISYEKVAGEMEGVIENIRKVLNVRIKSGHVKVAGQPQLDEQDRQSIANLVVSGMFSMAGDCNVVIVDDRCLSRHENIKHDESQATVFSTIDILDYLMDMGEISANDSMEYKTRLRRAGYFLIPVAENELVRYLSDSTVTSGMVNETAELKAIRENLLHVRMGIWQQFPEEIQWLHATVKVFVNVLRGLWVQDADLDKARVLSSWIVDQVDIRGWVHCMESDVGVHTAKTGFWWHVLLMFTPLLNVPQEVKQAYWDWLEDRVLGPVKNQSPGLYAKILDFVKKYISNVVNTTVE